MYDLPHVLLCSILAAAGADSYRAIVRFMDARRPWLRANSAMTWAKAPSHTGLRKILLGLDQAAVEQALRRQSQCALAAQEAGQIVTVALDGKTLRDSLDRAKGVSALQWLAAFTTSGQRLVLGQVAWGSGEKGYEINAVQRLIEELGMEGVLFTLDALHCQKKTLEFVVDSDCDLLVQVKANQPTLLKTIEDLAKQEPPVDTHKNHQRGLRIRIEARQTSVWHLPEQCLGDEWWPMRCLIQVCRHTDVFNTTQGNWEPRSETASPAPGYLFTESTP